MTKTSRPVEGVDAWRSIESAPKDGTPVIIYGPARGTAPLPSLSYAWGRVDYPPSVGEARFAAGLWQYRGCVAEPTHWMPLPSAPTEDGSRDASGAFGGSEPESHGETVLNGGGSEEGEG